MNKKYIYTILLFSLVFSISCSDSTPSDISDDRERMEMEKEMMDLRLEYEKEMMKIQIEHEAELFKIRINGEKELFEAKDGLQSQP